jgi:hypothetical protein
MPSIQHTGRSVVPVKTFGTATMTKPILTPYYNPRAHRFTKLDEDKVRAIRADPRPSTQVAKAYGVSHTTISEIRRFRGWKWVI